MTDELRLDFSLPDGLFTTAREFERDGEQLYEVEAKIFEEGDYPDKGVMADREYLEQLLTNTPAEVPVGLLHRGKPWMRSKDGKPHALARNLRLAADGLFATFELTEAAKDTLECAELKGVSVSLPRSGMPRISRIDPVTRPRVASARLFSQGNGDGADEAEELTLEQVIEFAEALAEDELDSLRRAAQSRYDKLQQKSGGKQMSDKPEGAPELEARFAEIETQQAALQTENTALKEQLAAESAKRQAAEFAQFSAQADREVEQWIVDGKLVPDQKAAAKALLLADGEAKFGEETKSVGELVRELIKSIPARQLALGQSINFGAGDATDKEALEKQANKMVADATAGGV